MSQENKVQILTKICEATQGKTQSLEKFVVQLKQQIDLLKLQNSNFFQDITILKESNVQISEENNQLKQDLKNYKNHIHNISKILDSTFEMNEISLRQFYEEIHLYLEKHFLDKMSDSLTMEEKPLFYEKRTPQNDLNCMKSNSDQKELVSVEQNNNNMFRSIKIRSASIRKTLNFPIEKNKKYYENISKFIVAPKYTSYLMTSPKIGGVNGIKSKTIHENDPEEISFKEVYENQESRLTINFIKVKSGSTSHIHKKSQVIEKIQTTNYEPTKTASPSNRKSFHSKMNSGTFNDKLFEKFMVIGVTKKDLLELQEKGNEGSDNEIQILPPKIIYNFPKDQTEELVIQDFTFPFGVPVEKIKGANSFSKINEIIFSNDQNDQSFIFNLKSQESYQKSSFKNNKVLCFANPNKMMYGVCVIANDYYETTIEENDYNSINRHNRKFWNAPNAYCFITYFPFMKLFVDLIIAILNVLKIRRVKMYSEKLMGKQEILHEIDAEFMLNEFNKEASHILQKCYSYTLLNNLDFHQKISISYNNQEISFLIPSQDEIYLLEGLWGSPLAFSNLCFDDFLFIFFSLILETPILFVSQNICLLTLTILTFFAMLKPFKWPHPSIFNLPFSLLPMFESPVPIIMGLNESMGFVLQNEYANLYSNFIFVFLDDNVILLKDSLAKDIGNSIPVFGNFKSRMRNIYEVLNPAPSTNFPNAKKNKKNPFQYKMPNINEKRPERKLNCAPTNNEMNACGDIFKLMKNIIENHILNRIPAQPRYNENDKNLDMKYIEEKILQSRLHQDQIFLKKLLKTQLFTYFIEEMYEL